MPRLRSRRASDEGKCQSGAGKYFAHDAYSLPFASWAGHLPLCRVELTEGFSIRPGTTRHRGSNSCWRRSNTSMAFAATDPVVREPVASRHKAGCTDRGRDRRVRDKNTRFRLRPTTSPIGLHVLHDAICRRAKSADGVFQNGEYPAFVPNFAHSDADHRAYRELHHPVLHDGLPPKPVGLWRQREGRQSTLKGSLVS
jgi:hypothetical protein